MTSFPVENGLVPIGPGQFSKLGISGTSHAKFQPLLKKPGLCSNFLDLDLYLSELT